MSAAAINLIMWADSENIYEYLGFHQNSKHTLDEIKIA